MSYSKNKLLDQQSMPPKSTFNSMRSTKIYQKKSDEKRNYHAKLSSPDSFKDRSQRSFDYKPFVATSSPRMSTDRETKSSSLVVHKIKSASWKRSAKTGNNLNTIFHKKTKALRKRSLTLDIDQSERSSICRPGTLYSDVLLGSSPRASSSVHKLTPRSSGFMAQNKLNRGSFKALSNEYRNISSSCDDLEYVTNKKTASMECGCNSNHNEYPALHNSKYCKPYSNSEKSSTSAFKVDVLKAEPYHLSPNEKIQARSYMEPEYLESKNGAFEEPDMILISDSDVESNDCNAISYGQYLNQDSSKHSKYNENSKTFMKSDMPVDVKDSFKDQDTNGNEELIKSKPEQTEKNNSTNPQTSMPYPFKNTANKETVTIGPHNQEQNCGIDKSYLNYLVQQSTQHGDYFVINPNTTNHDSSLTHQTFQDSPTPLSHFFANIPGYNFIEPDLSLDAFPKFMGLYNDEHYLMAERMAMLSLKSALGHNVDQRKFK